MLRGVFWIVAFMCLTSLGHTLGNDDANQYELIKGKFSDQWQSCLIAWSKTEGKITRQDKWTWKNEKKVENADYLIINDYPYTLAEDQTSVVVSGKKYHFVLTRNKPSDPWSVSSLENNANTQQESKKILFPSLSAESPTDKEALSICSQVAVGLQLDQNFIYLPSLWDIGNIIIDHYKRIENQEGDFHYIRFRCEQNAPHPYTWVSGPNDSFSIHGELWLTAEHFLISRADIVFNVKQNPWKLHQTCSYKNNNDSIPFPSDFYCRADLSTHIYEQTKHFDLKTLDATSESRFTLSYYGFPEPDFGNRRANCLRYTLMVIALGMIVWALLAMVRKRRQQKGCSLNSTLN